MAQEDSDTQQVQASELPVTILSQYIRDVSFENPNAPDSLKIKEEPAMDISIGLDARRFPDSDHLYEVALNARAQAVAGAETLFICEIQYAVVVQVSEDVMPENHHPLVFIEVPRHAFPFVRQIISNLVASGGFPPLFLNPVDFHKLYLDRFGPQANATPETEAAN